MQERPTFSQSWSRVARLTPTLRPQVQIERHLFRGEPWHVVHDPVSNSFFRLNPVAYHFVGLLDGRRSVDDAWRLTLDRFGDEAPTQNEVIGLLGQMNEANLLRVDLPPDAEPLLRRNRQRRMKFWGGQAMSILFLRIPVFNPDRLITWLLPLVKPMMTRWGMILWFIWMLYGIYAFIPYAGRFIHDAESVLDPSNWGWLIILFIAIKALHELGHGLVCKKFGGVVPEMGIMLLVLFPAPYVDATSAWAIPSKWKRLLVGSAGMIFELAVAAGAVHIWAAAVDAGDDGLARKLCYNLIFMASVSTILFNANPLLRFDGYYMLSDMLEVPNLYQRAQNQMKYLIKRFIYGMSNTPPVAVSFRESFWLLFYGIAALIYRVLILFGIILFISGRLMAAGILLAIWSTIAWGLVPLGKFIHWLATHPSLYEKRGRAVITTGGFVLALFIGIGVIPMDDHRRTMGVIESMNRADVTIQTEGFVTQVLVQPRQYVQKDQVLLRAHNPEMSARLEDLRGELDKVQLAYRQAIADSPADVPATRDRVNTLTEAMTELEYRLKEMELRSPRAGLFIAPDTNSLIGRFLPRGRQIGQVAELTDLRVTALVDQSHAGSAFLAQIRDVAEIRPAGRLSKPLESDVIRLSDSGTTRLPHASLGYGAGGPIQTDPQDSSGLKAMRKQFELWLKLPDVTDKRGDQEVQRPAGLPGERVYVRFTLVEQRPLLVQWLHRLRQIFRERVQN